MQIALIADPHVSLTDAPHTNIRLIDTVAVTSAIVKDVERRRPDMVIWLGDLTHDGTPQVRTCFAKLAKGLTLPCLWMLGNHDVEYVTKRTFADAFGPCMTRTVLPCGGWDVAILDTVPELTPHNPYGQWFLEDVELLKRTAQTARGPLLVLAHHPPREKYMDMAPFWDAVTDFSGLGVFIGGHSHRDLYSQQRGWHLVDVRTCCREPLGYHMLHLSPQALTLDFVPVSVTLTGPSPTNWAADEPIYPLRIPVRRA